MNNGKSKVAIGKRVRLARINKSMSQPELAYAIGKSKQLISAWENGVAEMTSSALARCALVLDVSADWLLFGIDRRK